MTPAARADQPRRVERRRPRQARGPASNRGLTMLEIVFAVVLLGLVATSTSSLLSLSARLHADNMQRLGAHEVANRLILMYLDDRRNFPSESEVIPQGNYRYRFSLKEDPVRMRVKQTAATARSQGQVPTDRFKLITLKVWIVAEGDNRYGIAGEEMAELTRVYDPLADVFRNPDSRDRLLASPDGIQTLIRTYSNIGSSQGQQQQQPPAQPGGAGRGGR